MKPGKWRKSVSESIVEQWMKLGKWMKVEQRTEADQ